MGRQLILTEGPATGLDWAGLDWAGLEDELDRTGIAVTPPLLTLHRRESVFVEERPRQQSRPLVARPGLGHGLIFPVRHRPVPGARGFRRVAMRHGVSQIRSGIRHVLGVIFHNAR